MITLSELFTNKSNHFGLMITVIAAIVYFIGCDPNKDVDSFFATAGLNRLTTPRDDVRPGALIVVHARNAVYDGNVEDYVGPTNEPVDLSLTPSVVDTNVYLAAHEKDKSLTPNEAAQFLRALLPDAHLALDLISRVTINPDNVKMTRLKISSLQRFLANDESLPFRERVLAHLQGGEQTFIAFEAVRANKLRIVAEGATNISSTLQVGDTQEIGGGLSYRLTSTNEIDITGIKQYVFAVRVAQLVAGQEPLTVILRDTGFTNPVAWAIKSGAIGDEYSAPVLPGFAPFRLENVESSQGNNTQPAVIIKLFYATDRKQVSSQPLEFSGERGDGTLHFGAFRVSIPRDHRLANIERPSIWRFEFREDSAKHFVIVEGKAEVEGDFYKDVADTVAGCREKEAFIFIHGFDVGFDDAVYRTAQIAYDLGFCGAPILYSWPSRGVIRGYTWDLNSNEWTVPHLQAFLEKVGRQTGATTIHLVAHSLGNRALVNALNNLSASREPYFHQIVLAAPDIDAGTFVQLAAAVKRHGKRVTLYVSSNDQALNASRVINGGQRAGDSNGDVVVVDGIDTVDVSLVDTDVTGHTYYGDNRSFLSDVFQLFQGGQPPRQRFGMRQIGRPPKTYWQFAP